MKVRAWTTPRLTAGALAAAFTALLIILAGLVFVWGAMLGGMPHIGATTAFVGWFFMLAALVVFLIALVVGAPSVVYARGCNCPARKYLVAGAAVLGVLLPAGWIGVFGLLPVADTVVFVVTGALAGAAACAMIWRFSGQARTRDTRL